MSRMSRLWSFAVIAAIAGALLLPASSAVGAPTAQKSGAIINYATLGKIPIKKKIIVPFVCSVDCNVVSTLKVKGPFVKGADTRSGTLKAGEVAGHFIKPSGPLLKLLRASPGRYKIVSHITATDLSSGASENIAHSFRLKR
jgi:hypothetical protein